MRIRILCRRFIIIYTKHRSWRRFYASSRQNTTCRTQFNTMWRPEEIRQNRPCPYALRSPPVSTPYRPCDYWPRSCDVRATAADTAAAVCDGFIPKTPSENSSSGARARPFTLLAATSTLPRVYKYYMCVGVCSWTGCTAHIIRDTEIMVYVLYVCVCVCVFVYNDNIILYMCTLLSICICMRATNGQAKINI